MSQLVMFFSRVWLLQEQCEILSNKHSNPLLKKKFHDYIVKKKKRKKKIEPIPTDIAQEARYTLDRTPGHHIERQTTLYPRSHLRTH